MFSINVKRVFKHTQGISSEGSLVKWGIAYVANAKGCHLSYRFLDFNLKN